MAVVGVLAQADVGPDRQVRGGLANARDGLRHRPVGIPGRRAAGVLGVGNAEEQHRADAERGQRRRLAGGQVGREARVARHRRDRLAQSLAGADEDRRDQLRRRQPGFLRQRAQRRCAAQAAAAMDGEAHDRASAAAGASRRARAVARRQQGAGPLREQLPCRRLAHRVGIGAAALDADRVRAIDGEGAGGQRHRVAVTRSPPRPPAPSSRRRARAARPARPWTARRVGAWSRADSSARRSWSASRHWTASAPCAGAGSISASENTSVMCCSRPEALQPGPGQHHRVEPALGDARHAGRDVAAQHLDVEVGTPGQHLGGAPRAAGADAGAARERRQGEAVAGAEHVFDRPAHRHRGDDEARRGLDRQVLVAVHRHVHLAAGERALDAGGEEPGAFDLGERQRR